MKKLLPTMLLLMAGSTHAADWGEVYGWVQRSLNLTHQQNPTAETGAAWASPATTGPQIGGFGAVANPLQSATTEHVDANVLLRQYLFNTSDEELLALLAQKNIENDIVVSFKEAVANGDRRYANIVRNQLVDILAVHFPYDAAEQTP